MDAQTQKLYRQWRKLSCVLLLFVLVLSALIYWVSYDELRYQIVKTDSVGIKAIACTLDEQTTCSFEIPNIITHLDGIKLILGKHSAEGTQELLVEVTSGKGSVLASTRADVTDCQDGALTSIPFDPPVAADKDGQLIVTLASADPAGQGTIYLTYGDSIDVGKFTVDAGAHKFFVNDQAYDGAICYSLYGRNEYIYHRLFWPVIGILELGLLAFCTTLAVRCKKNRVSRILYLSDYVEKYTFLVKQLVTKEFKRKYTRSILGALWSFLNPLLTMAVQYVVFSTLFRNNIDNYVVYLLSGIILFNFFLEASNLGMSSIIDNANLLTKVYMPKYIYPLYRVLFALINFLIALIPLLLVCVITGVVPTKAWLMLPLGIALLTAFSLGMAFLLSTLMVYFSDTQFLWGILATLWNYLTPVFYPISIIPAAWLTLYKLNPMYQFLTFFRTILIDGTAPTPLNLIFSILSSMAMLLVGAAIFRSRQKEFVIHL